MCGIAGVFGGGDERIVRRMLGKQVHRGPDDEHVVAGRGAVLGARRLSIVDLSTGRQPMTNEDGRVIACQNGEIYNFPDLRPRLLKKGHALRTHCDTEVLPHLWEDHGPDMAKHIDGMFAVAVWDTRTREGLLIRDRCGKKPLYWMRHEGALWWASEIKSLLEVPGFQRRMNMEALHHYLSYKHVPHPLSIFEGVHMLPPGSRLRFCQGGEPVVERYWRLSFAPDPSLAATTEAELVDQLLDLLKKGVKKRLMADVPIGFFLSGGVDSSLSTVLAAEMIPGRIKTFTLAYDVEKKTAMSTTTGTTGGYTVPTQHHDRLMELATEMSVVRPRATVIEMTGREIEVPSLDVTTAQAAGDTAFLGGLVARWTEEGGDKNQSEPSFKQTVLKNFELSGYSKISNAMMADSAVGLESFLFQMFAKAMAWYEDYAFLRGNGVGKPLGVVPWAGLLSATRSAASAFALADMAAMFAKWLGTYDPRSCCWVFQHSVLAKLYAMVSSSTMYIGDFQNTPKGNYLAGLPVLVSEKLPALNTAGDVLLCDWSQYLVGDRKQTEIAFSEHASFTANQTVWRFVRRVGGQPWLKTYVTLADASTTVSPFVALAAG